MEIKKKDKWKRLTVLWMASLLPWVIPKIFGLRLSIGVPGSELAEPGDIVWRSVRTAFVWGGTWPALLAVSISAAIVILWNYERSVRTRLVLCFTVVVYLTSALLIFVSYLSISSLLPGFGGTLIVILSGAVFLISFLFSLYVRLLLGIRVAVWEAFVIGIMGLLSAVIIFLVKVMVTWRYCLTGFVLAWFIAGRESSFAKQKVEEIEQAS